MIDIKRTFDDPILSNVDVEQYRGKRLTVYDGRGNILEDTDDRDIFHEMALRILGLRQDASREIDSLVPLQDQINAGMGLLTQAEADTIRTKINTVRTQYQIKKAQILAVNSLEELEQI